VKPIEFKEQNVIFGENQKEYLPLPANKSAEPPTVVTTCWGLTMFERFMVLLSGKIYVKIMTCGKEIQPQFLSTTFRGR